MIFSSLSQTIFKTIGDENLELGRRKRGQERERVYEDDRRLTQEVRDLGFICSEGSGIESLGITRVLLLASWQSLGTGCGGEWSRFWGMYRWMPNAECAKISSPQATTASARTPGGAFIAAKVLALRLGVNTAPSGNYWLKPLGHCEENALRRPSTGFLGCFYAQPSHVAGVGSMEGATQ